MAVSERGLYERGCCRFLWVLAGRHKIINLVTHVRNVGNTLYSVYYTVQAPTFWRPNEKTYTIRLRENLWQKKTMSPVYLALHTTTVLNHKPHKRELSPSWKKRAATPVKNQTISKENQKTIILTHGPIKRHYLLCGFRLFPCQKEPTQRIH